MSKAYFGFLLLHGFSSTPDNFRNLIPHLMALGLPYRVPTLTGHGEDTPDAIRGVNWETWLADGEKALLDLLTEAEKIIVIGHSMGGWIALNLSIDHREVVDSIIIAGAATRTVNPLGPGRPLHFLVPLFVRLIKKWDWPPVYVDQVLAQDEPAYPWIPTAAFLQSFGFMMATQKRLPEVDIPILIMHSKNDSINSPKGATILYNSIATPNDQKQLLWFEETEHSMFLDCEHESVNESVVAFTKSRINV